MFSLIYAWINDWVNNREAGELRRQHGHYEVIVMKGQMISLKEMLLQLPSIDLRRIAKIVAMQEYASGEIIQPSIEYRGFITIRNASIHLEWSHYKARDEFLHNCMRNYCINACLCISLKCCDVWQISSVVDITRWKEYTNGSYDTLVIPFPATANDCSRGSVLAVPERYFGEAKWTPHICSSSTASSKPVDLNLYVQIIECNKNDRWIFEVLYWSNMLCKISQYPVL